MLEIHLEGITEGVTILDSQNTNLELQNSSPTNPTQRKKKTILMKKKTRGVRLNDKPELSLSSRTPLDL